MNGSAVTDNGDDSTDGVTSRQAKCSRYVTRTRLNVYTHQFADAEDSSTAASGLGCLLFSLSLFLYLFLSLSLSLSFCLVTSSPLAMASLNANVLSSDISRRNPQDEYELIQRIGSGTYGDVYKVSISFNLILLWLMIMARCQLPFLLHRLNGFP